MTGIIVLLVINQGCQSQFSPLVTPTRISPKLEAKNPQIRGSVVDITQKDGKIVGIFVVGKIEAGTTFDKALIGITDKTVIYAKENSKYNIVTPGALKANQTVAVLFTGPIGDSYPVQAYADEIMILQ